MNQENGLYRIWINSDLKHEMINLKPRVWANLKVIVGNVYDQQYDWQRVALGMSLD